MRRSMNMLDVNNVDSHKICQQPFDMNINSVVPWLVDTIWQNIAFEMSNDFILSNGIFRFD